MHIYDLHIKYKRNTIKPQEHNGRYILSKIINVESTAIAIDRAAIVAADLSKDLNRIAESMRKSGDLSYATEVVSAIMNSMSKFRLDLMIIRPIREYESALNAPVKSNE